MSKLLLLEDDPSLSKTLIKYLSSHGHELDWAKNGEEAIDLSYDNRYDLYLLDINVPLLNGIDLLKALRDADDHTPAIIISALSDVTSVTQSFIAGADDYMKKPFDPEELLIRIRAKTSTLQKALQFKNFEIDMTKEEISYNGSPISLGKVQKSILLSLIKHHPDPVNKDDLMSLLDKPSDLTLRVHISKLKKKFDLQINNVRGVGYQII
ncbi:DNA-binding response regulator CiaR [hydrothermal vent metagenome]|uniref:DNA-binding response regulator CiaR n=1 Tax=hydrothermal vent metagenome TaxID=652676 RepID=A0A1W1C0W6_9ZZZZ